MHLMNQETDPFFENLEENKSSDSSSEGFSDDEDNVIDFSKAKDPSQKIILETNPFKTSNLNVQEKIIAEEEEGLEEGLDEDPFASLGSLEDDSIFQQIKKMSKHNKNEKSKDRTGLKNSPDLDKMPTCTHIC